VKIGAENKKQVQWMIALLVLALLVGIYNFVDFGSSSAASSPATASPGTQPKKIGVIQVADNTLDPRLRTDILAASQSKKYEAGRNIFRMEEVQIPKMEGEARVQKKVGPDPPPTPTPTPPPPQIPLKFYGFASKPNEPKKVFLDDDGEVFVAKQGEIVERRYKVVQINNTSVIIEDALNSNRQTIQVTPK
jgi:hypothetical protein